VDKFLHGQDYCSQIFLLQAISESNFNHPEKQKHHEYTVGASYVVAERLLCLMLDFEVHKAENLKEMW
jgi:hypothetical protein